MANLTGASDIWKTWAWWKNFNLTRKIKALLLNKYIRVNVRHRAFKCWLAQTSGFDLLALVAILNQTTQKNHPVDTDNDPRPTLDFGVYTILSYLIKGSMWLIQRVNSTLTLF